MYVALSLIIVMLFATLNLYLGFATSVYVRRRRAAASITDYLLFLVHREAFSLDLLRPVSADLAEINGDESLTESSSAAPIKEHQPTPADDAPTPDSHPIEVAFQRITTEMFDLGGEIADLDARLRQAVAEQDDAALQGSAASLNVAAHAGLDKLREAIETLAAYQPQSADFDSARIVIDNLAATLAAELNAALADLVGLSFGEDAPDDLRQRLIGAYEKVASATHGHRDRLVDALLAMVHCELGIENLANHLRGDRQTGLAARGGFETAIAEWRQDESLNGRPACLVMFDVDQLGDMNKQHGVKVGDAILAAVAEQVRRATTDHRDGHLATRIAGQQFVLVCPGSDIKDATEIAERVRQNIERATFSHSENEMKATLSAAVIEMAVDDTVDLLLDRMRSTVREAKSYGRNRTFLCEGDVPTPVVPIELDVAEAAIAV